MIETARLRLRPATIRDVPDLVAALNDWSVAQWLVRPPFPYTAEDARHVIRMTAAAQNDPDDMRVVIADRADDRLQGFVSLKRQDGRAELAYWLSPHAQGRGVMTEAAAAIIDHAAGTWSFTPMLFATVDPDNAASCRVLRRLDFVCVAEQPRLVPNRRGAPTHLLYERAMVLARDG